MTSTNKSHFPWPSDSPLTRLIVEKSSFDHPKSNLPALIRSHHFNQQVDLILPCNEKNVAEHFDAGLDGSQEFFYAVTAAIDSFLAPGFLDRYIRNPLCKFYALARDTPIDQSSTLAILPGGKLVMSVDGELYSQLGLQGTRESFGSEKAKKNIFQHKYRIDVDMGKAEFLPGDKTYDRVMWCFKDRIPAMKLLVVLYKNDKCSKIDFPEAVQDIKCYKSKISLKSSSIATPKLCDADTTNPKFVSDGSVNSVSAPSEQEAIMQEFLLWSGFVTCNIPGSVQPKEGSIESVLSQFRSGLKLEQSELCTSHIEGFLAPEIIQRYINVVKKLVEEKKIPWASVHVNGFRDAPVSFGNCSHSSLIYNGENDYTIVILPHQVYWQFICLGSKDKYS